MDMSTWDQSEGGSHRASSGSILHEHEDQPFDRENDVRRFSVSHPIESLRYAGGANSLDNFARSWQRAAGFHEISSRKLSFRFGDDETRQDIQDEENGVAESSSKSLLRLALDREAQAQQSTDDVAIVDDVFPEATENQGLLSDLCRQRLTQPHHTHQENGSFKLEPSISSIIGGSYGTTYGTCVSRTRPEKPSIPHGEILTENDVKNRVEVVSEDEPLTIRQLEQAGEIITYHADKSTLPQTVFNSVNVLIGVGILSLPLAFRYSGWIIGTLFFSSSAILTQYSAKLLAKCLDVDNSLITFADLAFVSYGHRARIGVSLLFTFELFTSCVALVILFSDSLNALLPGLGIVTWKIICGLILIPLSFFPLRFLSFTSVLGILSSFGIVLSVLIDGIIKAQAPGSLRQPVQTHLFPQNWMMVPFSFGMLMSTWGGHSVFPNIYRDMRHPHKYHRGLKITYMFTFLLDLSMAVVGLLMFGDDVREEVTTNIFRIDGYPQTLSIFIVICVAIIPLTKAPLNARPIISTVECFCDLSKPTTSPTTAGSNVNLSDRPLSLLRQLARPAIKILMTLSFVLTAIIFPSFDRLMALVGSVACFTICIILPVLFHLKLFDKNISKCERWCSWALVVGATLIAALSSVIACLPKEMLGSV